MGENMTDEEKKLREYVIKCIKDAYRYMHTYPEELLKNVINGGLAYGLTAEAVLDTFEQLMLQIYERLENPDKILRERGREII